MSERFNRIKAWMERQRSSEQALRILTQETGGRLFLLYDEDQLTKFADEIMRALRASRRS